MSESAAQVNTPQLSAVARTTAMLAAFLGWMCAGMEMSLMVPVTRPAIQDFLGRSHPTNLETIADQWLSWFVAAFLLGAALGGLLFGWLGDRIGRSKAMGLSVLCYSLVTGASYFVTSPEQLLVLRFVACLGIGGMWPCGVALVMEASPNRSRAFLAGWIGTAANVGFLVLGIVMLYYPITRDSWRWVMVLGGCPAILGIAILLFVAESPKWLSREVQSAPPAPLGETFRLPYLRRTLLGIVLGTVPLLGGWASGQRLIPWAGQVGEAAALVNLKATVQISWALGAVLGSLLGGWFASWLGNRLSYFWISALSLILSLYIFLVLDPMHPQFLVATFGIGLISTLYFGWLPYFLPTLFPVRVRAAGTGVAYNFGRIFSAIALLSSTALSTLFAGNIAKMGATTSLVYAAGILLVWMIPQQSELSDDS